MEFKTFILKTEAEVSDFMKYCQDYNFPEVTFDLETNSAVEVKAKVWGIGITFDGEEAFYLPIRDKNEQLIFSVDFTDRIINFISELCATRKIIAHNGIYDVLVWWFNYKVDLADNIYADTILYKHLVDEERPFALKEIAVKYLGDWADKAQDALYENIKLNGGSTTKDNTEMWKADTDILGEYCCWDVILCYKLYKLFDKKIKEEGLTELLEIEVMPLYREVTIEMKRHGVNLDVEMFVAKKEELKEVIKNVELEILESINPLIESYVLKTLEEEFPVSPRGNFPKAYAKMIGLDMPSMARKAVESIDPKNGQQLKFKVWMLSGDAELSPEIVSDVQRTMFQTRYPDLPYIFNINSKDDLKYLFFEKLKEKAISRTEKGDPKVDDEFLESIKDKYSWASKLQTYNVLRKMESTYLTGMLEREVEGKLYTSFLQFGTTSGRFASTNPNCLSLDTEILTAEGWKKYDQVTTDTDVACFDGNFIVWGKPSSVYLSEDKIHEMVTVKNEHFDMRLTANHRVIYRDRKSNKLLEKPARLFPKDAYIIHGAVLNSEKELPYSDNMLRFIIAAQADAYVQQNRSYLTFGFDKQRKKDRIEAIMQECNIRYTYRKKQYRNGRIQHVYHVPEMGNVIKSIIGFDKTFPKHWVGMSSRQRKLFLDEIYHWDGSFTRKNNYSSNNEANVDFIQALCALSGERVHKTMVGNNNYQTDVCKRDYSGTANVVINNFNSKERVWCVTVPTGMILVRRGSDTFITGNCQNWPAPQSTGNITDEYVNCIRNGIIAGKGYKLIGADFSSLEPHIAAFVSGDPDLIDIFVTGKDFYSAIGIKQFGLHHLSAFKEDKNYLGALDKDTRNKVKTYSLATFYGATAPRISQVLKCDTDEAQVLLDGYLDSFPGIRAFIENAHYDATTKGYVKTIFGRVRHLQAAKELYRTYGPNLLEYRWARSKGLLEQRGVLRNLLNNAVNFQIQGAAGHVMNRAMINTARLFKEYNLDAKIIMQIHDEQIVRVREDQAPQAAELMKMAMENAVDLSPIKLKATPIIGNSYGECK